MKTRRPENGARWYDYIPPWARIVVPVLTVLVSLAGFALGFGEGRGRTDAQVSSLAERVARIEHQRDGDQVVLGELRSAIAEMRGEVRAIGRALGVPLPGGTP